MCKEHGFIIPFPKNLDFFVPILCAPLIGLPILSFSSIDPCKSKDFFSEDGVGIGDALSKLEQSTSHGKATTLPLKG